MILRTGITLIGGDIGVVLYHTSHGSVRVLYWTTSKVNGKCQISASASSETLGSIFKKICKVDYVVELYPTPHANIGVNRFQMGRVCACMKLSPSGVYFFSFLSLMRIATGRPVGPIIAVNGSNDASPWRSRPFYCFVIKENIFPYFTQNVKNCITPYGNFEQL